MPLPYELNQSDKRPQICIGSDKYHTPVDVVDKLKKGFENQGYTVGVNNPFAGAIAPMEYYHNNQAVVSVMIEINRSLYLCEGTAECSDNYHSLKQLIGYIVRSL